MTLYFVLHTLRQGWQTFCRARVQIAYKFRTNVFAAFEKFEEQFKINKFLLIAALLLLLLICIMILQGPGVA